MQATNGGGGGADLNQQQQQMHQQQQQQQWMQQYQQQWMAMQYPAAAMVMQHPMMYQQHYMPYGHQSYQQSQQQQPGQQQNLSQSQIQVSSEENRTIWVGDLQQWMDEGYLNSCLAHTGEIVAVKVIRNKQTGQSERYGFVEFLSHAAAEKVLQSYNGTAMPNSDQTFRLNWATFSAGDKRPEPGSDLSIFVGDLASDVTDTVLHETFASRYPSVKSAKVVVDSNTGRSKGYGFVRFGDENEKSRAMTEMNGMYCSSRAMRIGVATPKKPSGQHPSSYASQALVLTGGNPLNGSMPQSSPSDGDSSNTTIFVGGLDSDVTDEDLKLSFSKFGEVVSIKIPVGKGCGFVQFANRGNAEDAIEGMNGEVIGKQTVRLSWGRTPANKQSNQRNGGGAYYGRQGYNNGYGGGGYGMQQQGQDPNMYAAAAAAAAAGGGGAYGLSSNGYGSH